MGGTFPFCGNLRLAGAFADHAGNVFGVPSDADQTGGTHRPQKMQPYEIQPRNTVYDSAFVYRAAILAEDRQIDPREARMVSGAPDDVPRIQRTIAGEQGLAIPYSDNPGYAFYAGVDQILRFHPHQRRGF